MNPFAAKLTEHLTADGRTVARIVRESDGLKLSTVHAYKAGHRIPANIATVDALAKALHLSTGKRDILARCYRYALELNLNTRTEVP